MIKAKIVSTGFYLPPKIQTAAELAPLIGRSEKWILSRTGVAERRIAEEPMDEMAAKAARKALQNGPPPDCIINASATPLQFIPDSSVFIQETLGYKGIPSWSIHSTCLSFFVALHSAASLIETGTFKRILIVSAEAGTPFRDLDEPESASLFGDAAAAAVIEPTPPGESSGIIDWNMQTWPEGAHLTEFPGAGTRFPPNGPETTPKHNLFHMKGVKIYKMARALIDKNLSGLYQRTGLSSQDIDWLILHQASGKAVQMSQAYGIPPEKTINIVAKTGNTIAASIPLVLATANHEGKLKRGDLLLMGGTGAGLSIAFSLIRW